MTRKATIDIRARDRALGRDLKRAERRVDRFGKHVKTRIGGAFRGGLATVGSFAAVGGLSSQLEQGMAYHTTLQRLGDQAKKSKTGIAALDKSIRAEANAWGLTNNEMLEATAQLVNLQGAGAATEQNMAFLGEAMTATGASAQNTSRVMSALMDQGVNTPEAMRAAFDALIEAGDAGNIPFDLMANNLSSILPMVKGLVSAGKQGHAEVGGLLQVLGKVTGGDISQAQTLTKALTNNLRQSRSKLRKKGYGDLFDSKGNLRHLYDIRDRLGDLGQDKRLIKLITSSEARSAIKAIDTYRDTWEQVTEAALASDATHRKASSFMQSSAGKWRQAMASIHNKFAEAMTPDRIEAVADAAGYLVEVLGFASDHLGVLIGAWAAWKGLGLLRYIGDVAGSMKMLGGVSSKAGAALGVLKQPGSLGLLGAVGGATYAIGTYVDRVAGLSDKLASISGVDTRGNLQKGRDLQAKAEGTRDWLQGVHSGRIEADGLTRRLVSKRMRGDALTDDERTVLKWKSGHRYGEGRQNWESALAEAQRFIVPAQNRQVDAHNARVRDRARELIDSGAAVSSLRDMGLRDNEQGHIDTGMVLRYMASKGLDSRRREFVPTGDAQVDSRLSKDRAATERRLDAELVAMLVSAIEKAKLEVKADVSLDSQHMTEALANAQAQNRSY